MFASHQAPFGGGESFISVDLGVLLAAQQTGSVTDSMNIHIAFLDAATLKTVGQDDVDDSSLTRDYCCTQDHGADCGPGVTVGGLIQHPGSSGVRAAVTSFLDIPVPKYGSSKGPTTFHANVSHTVLTEGPQWMLAVACDAHGTFVLPAGTVYIRAAFHNPHGYLPGQWYGMLPWTGTFFVLYLLFVLSYSIIFCMRKKHIIGLQWLVMSVLAFSLLEMVVAFGVYDGKNKSGVPTPCNVCPITSDYLAAVVLAVFKRAFSRVLLLAVAKGYGVVHSNLPWKTWVGILGLGTCYLLFGSLNEVERETSYGLAPSGWELPVVVVDMVTLVYTYGGFVDMRKALTDSGQTGKKKMYDNLWKVIMLAIGIYTIVAAVILAFRLGAIGFPWKSLFFLVHFWDLLYFLILCAVAWLWRPGPDTAQLSYYATVGQDENGEIEQGAGPDGAEAVAYADTAGIELTSPPSGDGAGQAGGVRRVGAPPVPASGAKKPKGQDDGIPPPDAFVIETTDDSDELDGDLSRGTAVLSSGAAHTGGTSGGQKKAVGAKADEPVSDTARLAGNASSTTVDTRRLSDPDLGGKGQSL